MKVEVLTISGETSILIDKLIICNQFLQIENHSILFDFLDLLEESRVKGTLLNIETDATDFLTDIKLEFMFFHDINCKHEILNIGSHYTDN